MKTEVQDIIAASKDNKSRVVAESSWKKRCNQELRVVGGEGGRGGGREGGRGGESR